MTPDITISKLDSTVNDIKNRYEKYEDKFHQLYGEIINIARRIKIWDLIAKHVTKYGRDEECDDFWGWLQIDPIFRLTIIDVVKIYQDTRKTYIKHILNNILDDSQLKGLLIKKSKLQSHLDELTKIAKASGFDVMRNNILAHFDLNFEINFDIKKFNTDLEKVFICIRNILDSLSYISSYLLNPDRLVSQDWDMLEQAKPINSIDDTCYLNDWFEDDYTIHSCKTILEGKQSNATIQATTAELKSNKGRLFNTLKELIDNLNNHDDDELLA